MPINRIKKILDITIANKYPRWGAWYEESATWNDKQCLDAMNLDTSIISNLCDAACEARARNKLHHTKNIYEILRHPETCSLDQIKEAIVIFRFMKYVLNPMSYIESLRKHLDDTQIDSLMGQLRTISKYQEDYLNAIEYFNNTKESEDEKALYKFLNDLNSISLDSIDLTNYIDASKYWTLTQLKGILTKSFTYTEQIYIFKEFLALNSHSKSHSKLSHVGLLGNSDFKDEPRHIECQVYNKLGMLFASYLKDVIENEDWNKKRLDFWYAEERLTNYFYHNPKFWLIRIDDVPVDILDHFINVCFYHLSELDILDYKNLQFTFKELEKALEKKFIQHEAINDFLTNFLQYSVKSKHNTLPLKEVMKKIITNPEMEFTQEQLDEAYIYFKIGKEIKKFLNTTLGRAVKYTTLRGPVVTEPNTWEDF